LVAIVIAEGGRFWEDEFPGKSGIYKPLSQFRTLLLGMTVAPAIVKPVMASSSVLKMY
jgi:hypothetical protein